MCEILSSNICRLCLKNSDNDMPKLDNYKIMDKTARECCEELCGIMMPRVENLSESICGLCYGLLEQGYNFRVQVRKNANILQEIYETNPIDPIEPHTELEFNVDNIKEEVIEIVEFPEDDNEPMDGLDYQQTETTTNLYDESSTIAEGNLRINPFYVNEENSNSYPAMPRTEYEDENMLLAVSAVEVDNHVESLVSHQGIKQCPFCNKVFQSSANMRKHISLGRCQCMHNQHEAEIKLNTSDTGLPIITTASTVDRYPVPPKGSRKCPNCGKKFSSSRIMLRHYRINCRGKKVNLMEVKAEKNVESTESASILYPDKTCPDCKKVFSSSFNVQLHLKLNRCPGSIVPKMEEERICVYCKKEFTSSSSVLRHQKENCEAARRGELYESTEVAVAKAQLQKMFEEPTIKTTYEEDRTWYKEEENRRKCPKCKRVFSCRKNMRTHLKYKRCKMMQKPRRLSIEAIAAEQPVVKSDPLRCPSCKKTFSTEHSMARHYSQNCPVKRLSVNDGEDEDEADIEEKQIHDDKGQNDYIKPDPERTCPHCGKYFVSAPGVEKHLHYRRCTVLFPGREEEKRMLEKMLNFKGKRRCPACHKKFTTSQIMQRHYIETCPARIPGKPLLESLPASVPRESLSPESTVRRQRSQRAEKLREMKEEAEAAAAKEKAIQALAEERFRCKFCNKQLSSLHSLQRHEEISCKSRRNNTLMATGEIMTSVKLEPKDHSDQTIVDHSLELLQRNGIMGEEAEPCDSQLEEMDTVEVEALDTSSSNLVINPVKLNKYKKSRSCPHCQREFANPHGVRRHLRLKRCQQLHPRVYKTHGPKKCDACGSEYPSYYLLSQHKKKGCLPIEFKTKSVDPPPTSNQLHGNSVEYKDESNDEMVDGANGDDGDESSNCQQSKFDFSVDDDNSNSLSNFLTLMQHKITNDFNSKSIIGGGSTFTTPLLESLNSQVSDIEEIRTCPLCHIEFATTLAMERHLRLHECGQEANKPTSDNDNNNSSGHLSDTNTGETSFTQMKKRKEIGNTPREPITDDIQDHIIIIRNKTICHVCRRCGKEFSSPYDLQNHLALKCLLPSPAISNRYKKLPSLTSESASSSAATQKGMQKADTSTAKDPTEVSSNIGAIITSP